MNSMSWTDICVYMYVEDFVIQHGTRTGKHWSREKTKINIVVKNCIIFMEKRERGVTKYNSARSKVLMKVWM